MPLELCLYTLTVLLSSNVLTDAAETSVEHSEEENGEQNIIQEPFGGQKPMQKGMKSERRSSPNEGNLLLTTTAIEGKGWHNV